MLQQALRWKRRRNRVQISRDNSGIRHPAYQTLGVTTLTDSIWPRNQTARDGLEVSARFDALLAVLPVGRCDTAQHPGSVILIIAIIISGKDGNDEVAFGDYKELLAAISKRSDDPVAGNTVGAAGPPLKPVAIDPAASPGHLGHMASARKLNPFR